MKFGILIQGKDYGALGLSEEEYDAAFDERLEMIESHGLIGGGGLIGRQGEFCEFCAEREDGKDCDVDFLREFSSRWREKFPTFDGHIYICDVNHATSEEHKVLDRVLKP